MDLKPYLAYLPGNDEPVTAYEYEGVWYADCGGAVDRAPEGTVMKLEDGVYELGVSALKYQDADF